MPTDQCATEIALRLHKGGKIEVRSAIRLRDNDDLALAYTPGVGYVTRLLSEHPELIHDFTWRANLVAVVTDGTAVLGLGNVGPEAALPVMEGKALLFKEMAGINAVPICLGCTDPQEIIDTICRIAPSFGGINLEDISAPRCFEIEDTLQASLSIPVFHDDQHGTAIVVLAALQNASKVARLDFSRMRVVVSGAGAAGYAVSLMLHEAGVPAITVVDSAGILHPERTGLNSAKRKLAEITNPDGMKGSLREAMKGANVFIGVSGGEISEDIVASLADGAIIFALANPTPEIDPGVAARYASVVGTGRSDFPNQINNVLAFPGVFKGALAVRATRITPSMKLAAAEALSQAVQDPLGPEKILPSVFDPTVAHAVAQRVAAAAIADNVARTGGDGS
jgi:malate dehydrogenase (oxaloacetate-decarboxylating)